MLGVKYMYTSFNNNKTNVNTNSNYYANNGGGSSTMKKKYSSKFNKVSSKSNFSINGNNYHSYIGNPNSNFSHDPFSNSSNILLCKTHDTNIKTSVKNTKGLMQTRIVNQKIKSNPVNSFKCYLNLNKELKERYDNDIEKLNINLNNCDSTCCNNISNAGVNKHFNNKDSSSLTEQTKTKCFVDRSNYLTQIQENQQNKINNSNCIKKCNITKDLKEVNAFIPSYDIYMLKKKKCCNYNPRDEFVRGKCDYTSIKQSYPHCN
jgi:hypothetical protein